MQLESGESLTADLDMNYGEPYQHTPARMFPLSMHHESGSNRAHSWRLVGRRCSIPTLGKNYKGRKRLATYLDLNYGDPTWDDSCIIRRCRPWLLMKQPVVLAHEVEQAFRGHHRKGSENGRRQISDRGGSHWREEGEGAGST